MANRHRSRVLAVQSMYAWDMTGTGAENLYTFDWLKENVSEDTLLFARLIIAGVLENIKEIDDSISKNLYKWDIKRIRRVDLAILRISAYSLLFQKDIPSGVVINEAIEISKEFAQDDSYKFVNGVLDGIAKSII